MRSRTIDEHDDPYAGPDEEPLHRPPRYNLAAEQGLLGAILHVPELAGTLAEAVDPADFYQPRHETIWHAIRKVATTGQNPDPALVLEQLRTDRDLDRIGGAEYLHDCMAACSSPYQAQAYAAVVVDHARWRTFDEGLRRVRQRLDSANPDTIGDTLADVLDTFDHEVIRQGARTATTSTGRRDLAWILNGQPPDVPPPVYGRREDGHALFYAARVNGVFGDPESAKTWLAMMAAVEALQAGDRVGWIDVDHNGQELTVERLLLLGARPDQIGNPDLFGYYEPDDGTELRAAITELVAWRPAVAVLDSIGEMLPMLGAGSENNDEITVALRTIAKPLADAGAAVITIDHLPKSHEARTSGYAIGGTAKKRAVDGSLIHAEPRTAPAPGQLGKIHLRIEKDRPGRLRQTCAGKYIGTFVLDSRQPNLTTATIDTGTIPTNDSGGMRPTERMEQVSKYLERLDLPQSGNQICAAIKGRDTITRDAITRLIEEGHVTTIPGRHSAVLHKLIAVYREGEDDAL